MHAYLETIVCKFGSDRAILLREVIFVPARKCPYHVTFDLDLEHTLETIVCKFGGDLAIFLREAAICAKVYRLTDRRTDGRRTPRHCISLFLE